MVCRRPVRRVSAVGADVVWRLGLGWMTARRETRIDRSPIESLLYWGLIPAWGIPGLVDWWYHRRSQIERPDHGGTKESLIHSLMLAESGIVVVLALLDEVNPAALAVMTAVGLAHEVTANRDVQLASGSAREVTAGEQQTHSVLETLPFVLAGLLAASNWPQLRSTWRQSSSWRLRRRGVPFPARYLLGVAAALTATGAIPYAEELLRCLRHAPTRPRHGGYSRVMSTHRDHDLDDDDQQQQSPADRQPPDGRPQPAGGKPTGEKQAAANRENDPPA